MNITRELEERFLAKIEFGKANECWPWVGAQVPYGPSGVIFYREQMLYAHRIAYQLLGGKTLPPYRNRHVLHRCGLKVCCNPKHLFIGTLADAHALMAGFGKKRMDMRRGKHALTARQRNRIRTRALRGDAAAVIQRDYPSIHYSTVLKYVRRTLMIKNNR